MNIFCELRHINKDFGQKVFLRNACAGQSRREKWQKSESLSNEDGNVNENATKQ